MKTKFWVEIIVEDQLYAVPIKSMTKFATSQRNCPLAGKPGPKSVAYWCSRHWRQTCAPDECGTPTLVF